MAVTRKAQTITMTAASDAVTGKMRIQSITMDHTAAASFVLQDTASVEIARGHITATLLTLQLIYPKGLIVDGIKASTLSAGQLAIHLMP